MNRVYHYSFQVISSILCILSACVNSVMPLVWIPKAMQSCTGGKETVEMGGRTVQRLVAALDETYPGLKDILMDGDRLKPGVAVAVNGQVSQLGALQPLQEDDEVFFIPAIGGG